MMIQSDTDEAPKAPALRPLSWSIVLGVDTEYQSRKAAHDWIPATLARQFKYSYKETCGEPGHRYYSYVWRALLSQEDFDLLYDDLNLESDDFQGETLGIVSALGFPDGWAVPAIMWERTGDDRIRVTCCPFPVGLKTQAERSAYQFADWEEIVAEAKAHYGLMAPGERVRMRYGYHVAPGTPAREEATDATA